MPPLFTINACKSAGCRNLGLPDSPDYVWPDYRLGYPALHCRACGSYPPLFNEGEFR
ncbi:cytoplasmic protein, partial [Salmonella enterica subsp. enterica serovar Kentucky]|nr:cytoplasmic protein [Salmonella enterica subsp. enterica serovar Kentucky]